MDGSAEPKKLPLLVVLGPTASGKTELAVRLARAFSGEVVSADSMQVYKGMPVATAAPTPEETRGVPHHLVGILAPEEPFSAAAYAARAHAAIREIRARGRLPILAGGTGLYVSSVLENIAYPEQRDDPAVRERLRQDARRDGAQAMLRRLSEFDPETAGSLHPGNLSRILRAIEIYELTGVSMSEHKRRSKQTPSPYAPLILGIGFADRQKLYDRINLRVDRMLENGLLDEAARFFSRKQTGRTSAQAIGHKELAHYFRGECTLGEAVELLKRETRRYAKRQMTWFSKIPDVHWLLRDQSADLFEDARRILLANPQYQIMENF